MLQVASNRLEIGMKANLRSIQHQYQAFLFDLWGVVHDGHSAFPGVVSLINELIACHKKVILFRCKA
jgi:hypothetical protein